LRGENFWRIKSGSRKKVGFWEIVKGGLWTKEGRVDFNCGWGMGRECKVGMRPSGTIRIQWALPGVLKKVVSAQQGKVFFKHLSRGNFKVTRRTGDEERALNAQG